MATNEKKDSLDRRGQSLWVYRGDDPVTPAEQAYYDTHPSPRAGGVNIWEQYINAFCPVDLTGLNDPDEILLD